VTVPGNFELWGSFSVADHKRPHAFVADVLVYDRLIVPTPAGDDDDRWARNEWDTKLQATTLDVLRDGDQRRVLAVPWDAAKRALYKERTMELAADAAFDMAIIDPVARDNPNTPAQGLTRLVLKDNMDAERDAQLLSGIMRGLPQIDVQVVAAYPTLSRFSAETGVEEGDATPAKGSDLLGGFAWPFVVPAEEGRSNLDQLKRSVEFANHPEVQSYRQAFHRWRYDIVLDGKSPLQAAEELREQIGAYGEWAHKLRTRNATHTACAVLTVGAGVATSAVLPFVATPTLVGSLIGVGAASAGLVELIAARPFRRRHQTHADVMPGALFWTARQALS
jgi:hypothetical protein